MPADTNLTGVGYKGGGSTLVASQDFTLMKLTNPRVGIEHLDFDGSRIVNNAALWVQTSEVLIRDSRLLDCGLYGIYCSGTESDMSVERCRTTGRSLIPSYGICFDMTSSGNVRTLGNYVTNFDTAIKVYGTVGSIHIGNYLEAGTTGAWLQDACSCWLTNTFEAFKGSDFLIDSAATMPTIICGGGSGSELDSVRIAYADGAAAYNATVIRNEGLASQFPQVELVECPTTPQPPPAGGVFLFAKAKADDTGKSQLLAEFGSGAVQVIATEP